MRRLSSTSFCAWFRRRAHGADLFVDAQGLFPIEALQVYICHALQDVRVPIAVGIALLYHAQGGGVGFARHIQFGETIVDGGQFKIFTNGIVDLSACDELIDEACARSDPSAQVEIMRRRFWWLAHFAAHAVGMSHDAVFCDCICVVIFLYEQVAHQHVERKVGRRVLHGIVGFVHCGAQASHACQLIDAVHRFKHGAGLRLQDHICKRGDHVAVLLWAFVRAFYAVVRANSGRMSRLLMFSHTLTQDGFIRLVFMRFDQRLILLADFVCLFGGNGHRVGKFQRFKIFHGGFVEACRFLCE